jgi:uncharacterized protein YbjT (DUF2867 family)
MKVFVTGATGFVGQEIVRQLAGAGHSIRILARSSHSRRVRDLISRYGAEVRVGDVVDSAPLTGAAAGADAIIHLVGIISEVGDTTFENLHTLATRNLLAVAQQAGIKRFLQMSALGTRPQAVSRYHQTKWVAEEAVRRSGLDYTIFRPSLIYGPRDHFVNLFAKIIRLSPVVPVIGGPHARFQPIALEAVAAAFVRALTQPRSTGQAYDLCGPEALTLGEILDQIMAAMGKKRLKLRVPLGLARCQAALLEFVFPCLLRKAPPLNRDQLIMLQEDTVGNPQPANEVFGLERISFREGIAKYLKRDA